MGRGLVRTVIVEDDRGERVILRPGQPVPAWAVDRIKNPAAWGEVSGAVLPAAPSAHVETATPLPADAAPAPAPEPVPERAPAAPAESERVEPAPDPPAHADPPPKGGRGSSAAAWRSYAEAVGHPVPSDMERDDVIEYLDKRDVRTE